MVTRSREKLLVLLALATTVEHAGAATAAAGSAYPTHPIRLILGYPPGGASDAVARLLAQAAGARMGQNVVIDNRPGAGGNIAGDIAARAASSVIPHVRSTRLRALAVTSLKRSPTLPDLPTVDESGVPRFEAITWHGIVVPAATPAAVVGRINAELNHVLAAADIKEKLAVQGVEAQGGTAAQFATYLKSEIPKWTKVVRDSGAKPE